MEVAEEVKWTDLMSAPNGTVFQEIDLPTDPLYIKAGVATGRKTDLMVKPLYHFRDGGTVRFGFAEMDDCDRNSKRFHILTEEEINTIIGRLMALSL